MCILPWNATVDWIFWEYWGVNGLPAYRGAFDVLLPQIPRCLMVAERVLAHGMSQISWHGLGYTEQQTVDIGTFSPLLVAPAFHPCDGHPEIMDISELFIHMASKSWLFVTSMMFHHDSLSRETSGPFTWKHYNYWFFDQVLSTAIGMAFHCQITWRKMLVTPVRLVCFTWFNYEDEVTIWYVTIWAGAAKVEK